jgi:glycosyltransferase involved in cell wall biosynthesis
MKRVLYITYDGLLDPLGGSQILPYVTTFPDWHERVLILSFEKPQRLASADHAPLAERLSQLGILWKPLTFTRRGGAFGKVWDLFRMYAWAIWLAARHRTSTVHGRGHPATQVGLFVKKLMGVQLVFDCRGLWADERIDKGSWNMRRFTHRLQYRHFKNVEKTLLWRADHVVVLTNAVVPELVGQVSAIQNKVTVIPCCADFDLFQLTDQRRQAAARSQLGLADASIVLGYVGSIGSMYMVDRFLRLCELALSQDPAAHALVLTPDPSAMQPLMKEHLAPNLQARMRVRCATRTQVAELIPAMDVLVSFIRPSYARIASSPTKLAECLAEGVPAICNPGVGDVTEQLSALDGGIVIDPMSDDALQDAVAHLSSVRAKGGLRLRIEARKLFGLEVAVARYQSIYAQLQEPKVC